MTIRSALPNVWCASGWLVLAALARLATPATGQVTWLAGSGTVGSADGPGRSASFHRPAGAAIGVRGTLYVADSANNTIRRIAADGMVTTLAGSPGVAGSADGIGRAAHFFHPSGVAIDASGILYVADTGNATIRRIMPDGRVSTLAGSAGALGDADGVGPAARFIHPVGIAVDAAGNVFAADAGSSAVRRITPAGVVTTCARLPGLGAHALAAEPTGTLLVAGDAEIRRIDASGTVKILARGAFDSLESIAVDAAGWIYAADHNRGVVLRLSPDGLFVEGEFLAVRRPVGLAIDASGNIYVATAENLIGVARPHPGMAVHPRPAMRTTGNENPPD